MAVADLTTDVDPDPLLRNAIYWWNPGTKSYDIATSIAKGQGYWMATTEDCTLCMQPSA